MDQEPIQILERQKPIAEAAAAVEAAAAKAKQMLEQIQTTKWWAILTATKSADKQGQ